MAAEKLPADDEEQIAGGLKEPTVLPLVRGEKRKAGDDQPRPKRRIALVEEVTDDEEVVHTRSTKRKGETPHKKATKKRPLLLTLK